VVRWGGRGGWVRGGTMEMEEQSNGLPVLAVASPAQEEMLCLYECVVDVLLK